jgi:hypothetical protein
VNPRRPMLKLGSPSAPAPHRASGLESKFRCTICCASPRRTGISAPALLSRERVSAGMSGLSGHYGDGMSGLILPGSCVRITSGLLRFDSVISSTDRASEGAASAPPHWSSLIVRRCWHEGPCRKRRSSRRASRAIAEEAGVAYLPKGG